LPEKQDHGWHLDFYDEARPFASVQDLGLTVDVLALARSNGAREGTPFFVSPDGRPDARLNRFWREPSVRTLARESQRRYAYSLKVWLNFLHAYGVEWDQAGPDTVAAFKEWRMSALEADEHVGAGSFGADLAAIKRLYGWASLALPGIESPIRVRSWGTTKWDEPSERMELSPSGIRRADVKWLTPDAYRLWRDIGLAGFTREGVQSERWVGDNEDRDVGFADGLFGTGLRRAEWSSLLTLELPPDDGSALHRRWLASACGKRGRGRRYWVSGKVAAQVRFYLEDGSRQPAVARAQQAGRYEALPQRWLLEQTVENGSLVVRDAKGQQHRTRLDALTPAVRSMLFKQTPSGLEPLSLWLNENGLPRPKNAWNKTFAAANKRVGRELASDAGGQAQLWARPHMLRHSFALRWYTIATFVAWQRTSGLSPDEQRDLRHQLGDVWFLLATLLGHRSAETTRNSYLEPFQSLQIEQLMALMDSDDRAALERLVDAVADAEPRVLTAASA
jgi:integrase